MVLGISDEETKLAREGDSVWALHRERCVGCCPAHHRFDALRFEVDSADAMILGVDHEQSPPVVEYKAFGTTEGRLQGWASITAVSFLTRSGDVVNRVLPAVDSPDAVAFAKSDPDRVFVDGQRAWPEEGHRLCIGTVGGQPTLAVSADRCDDPGIEVDAAQPMIHRVGYEQSTGAIEDNAVGLFELNCFARFAFAGESW